MRRTPSSAGPPAPAGPLKIWRFFPSSDPIFALFLSLSLSGGLLVEFWWCPGFHTTARELQTCTFEGPGASKTPPKFHEKSSPEREQERKWRRERQKTRNFGPPAFGPPPFEPPRCGALTFSRSVPHPSGPHPSGLHPSGGGPPGPHFFLCLGTYVPHFYHVAHLFFLCIF